MRRRPVLIAVVVTLSVVAMPALVGAGSSAPNSSETISQAPAQADEPNGTTNATATDTAEPTTTATETPTASETTTPTDTPDSTTTTAAETSTTDADTTTESETTTETSTATTTATGTTTTDTDTTTESNSSTTTRTEDSTTAEGETTTGTSSETAVASGSGGDDRASGGTYLDVPGSVNGRLSDGDTVDWYRFEGTAGQAFKLVTSRAQSPGAEIHLYDPSGEFVFSSSVGDGSNEWATGRVLQRTGTYYLRVSRTDDRFNSYYFEIRTANRDSFEPNDDRDGAITIGPGEEREGTIVRGDADWFAIDAEAGEAITVSTDLVAPSAYWGEDLNVDVYDPNGNTVASGGVYADTVASTTESNTQTVLADESGTYYVRITGRDIGGFSRYTLDVSTTESQSTDASIAAFTPTGGTFQRGESQQASVTVTNTGTEEQRFFVGYLAVTPSGEELNNDDSTGTYVTLAPGEQRTVQVGWTVEEETPTGVYGASTSVWSVDGGDLDERLDTASEENAFVVLGETSGDLPNTIVISGANDESSATYQFRVTDRIEAVRTNPDDDVGPSGSRVNGYVFQSEDEYRFSGEIRNFGYDGSIRVFVNGEEVDPEALAGSAEESGGSGKESASSQSGAGSSSESGSGSGSSGTSEDTPTPVEVSNGGSSGSPEDGSTQTSGGDSVTVAVGPGFGVLPAAVAVLFVCVLAFRRQFGE